jgi:hypothetical protein
MPSRSCLRASENNPLREFPAAGHCLLARALLLLRKLALEMAFDIFTTKRVSCVGQDDRIDDLITCKLSGDKCAVVRQFLVYEFHFSAVFKRFDPFFVWHLSTSSAEIRVCREYTLFVTGGWRMKSRLLGIWHSNGARGTTMETFACRESLPERTIPESLAGDRGEKVLDSRCAICIHPTTNLSYPILPNSLSKLCSLDQPAHSFQAMP